MTPQQIVSTANKLAPTHWAGQQIMIRRLARTNGVGQSAMHDAIRLGVKEYLKNAPVHLRPFNYNFDTPADVRALYLQSPSLFGLNTFRTLSGWAKNAGNGTLIKMKSSASAVAAFVLFQRNRQECMVQFKSFHNERSTTGASSLHKALIENEWSSFQLDCMKKMVHSDWFIYTGVSSFALVNRVVERSVARGDDLHADGMYDTISRFMKQRSMDLPLLETTMCPYLFAFSVADSVARVNLPEMLVKWEELSPTKEDCVQLASILENVAPTSKFEGWEQQTPTIQKLVSALGWDVETKEKAVKLYNSMDPSLIGWSNIMGALHRPPQEEYAVSEFLCP